MTHNDGSVNSLSVTTLTSYFPECEGPFQSIPYAAIGTLFHDMCSSLPDELAGRGSLWAGRKTVLRSLTDSAPGPEIDQAIQPMRSFIYDNILQRRRFKKFHEPGPSAVPKLWKAMETLLVELVSISKVLGGGARGGPFFQEGVFPKSYSTVRTLVSLIRTRTDIMHPL